MYPFTHTSIHYCIQNGSTESKWLKGPKWSEETKAPTRSQARRGEAGGAAQWQEGSKPITIGSWIIVSNGLATAGSRSGMDDTWNALKVNGIAEHGGLAKRMGQLLYQTLKSDPRPMYSQYEKFLKNYIHELLYRAL